MARILICSMNYKPEIIAIGKYSSELAEYLVSVGHNVEVITTFPHYPGWKVFSNYSNWKYLREDVCGVKVTRVPMYLNEKARGIIRLIMPATFGISSFPLMLWKSLRFKPDVVVMVQPTMFSAPASLLAAWIGGAKSMQHVQDLEMDAAFAVGHVRATGVIARLALRIEQWLLKRFDHIVTISYAMRDSLIKKGIDLKKVSVIRNWVDTDAISLLPRESIYRKELGIHSNAFVVQYSGQMGKKQALHLIIEAAESLVNDSRFVFVMAGDGPMRAEIDRRMGSLPNARILPLQPTEKLGEFLNLADVHILPQEAGVSDLVLPSKLGGMLASGKRMLITADADSELAKFLGGSAVFTPPGDYKAIVTGILDMIETEDKTYHLRKELACLLSSKHILKDFEENILKDIDK
jgi:colanic acid biosynthesis glycosyl transferase WcaI